MRLTDAARSLVLNSKSANILADKAGRILTVPSAVRVYAAASAAGMRMSILVSSPGGVETVLDDQEISRANRFPVIPDDLVHEFGAGAGSYDELMIFLRNTTGGTLTADTVVDITPV